MLQQYIWFKRKKNISYILIGAVFECYLNFVKTAANDTYGPAQKQERCLYQPPTILKVSFHPVNKEQNINARIFLNWNYIGFYNKRNILQLISRMTVWPNPGLNRICTPMNKHFSWSLCLSNSWVFVFTFKFKRIQNLQ